MVVLALLGFLMPVAGALLKTSAVLFALLEFLITLAVAIRISVSIIPIGVITLATTFIRMIGIGRSGTNATRAPALPVLL